MGLPDRIECTAEVAHPLEKVRAALTAAEGLSAWFGDEATIGLRPGGAARMRWNEEGFTAGMRVERVEEPTVFGFTWHICGLPADDPRRTYVGFTLEPLGAGTRLTVVQSGFAAHHPGRAGLRGASDSCGPGRCPADYQAGDRQAPGPAGRGRPGDG